MSQLSGVLPAFIWASERVLRNAITCVLELAQGAVLLIGIAFLCALTIIVMAIRLYTSWAARHGKRI